MELSQLPHEMVVAIADHLEARDITACSGVSIGWRRAFNLDLIWKNFCSYSPDYFEEEANSVKPSFETPFIEGSQLESLCEWRVVFLKELYMMKNWKRGQFSCEEVELRTNNCLYAMDAIDKDQNHWLFLCCSAKEGVKLEVWNIKSSPYLHMSTKMSSILKNGEEIVRDASASFKMHLSGEKFILIYDNLVTVYNFVYPFVQLDFLYNFSFVHTAPFFTPRRIPHLPEGSLCKVEIIHNFLYGVSYSHSDRVQQFSPSVHVWDLGNATKVNDHCDFEPRGEELFPFICNLFLTSGFSQNLVITRTFHSAVDMCTRVRVFDRIKYEYNKFVVQLKFPVFWVTVHQNIFVLCELINLPERDCVFYFYEISSGLCLLKSGTYNIYDPDKISSCGSKFSFIDLTSNITVFDIETQQAFTCSIQPSRNRLKTITMVSDQLLLLESKYRGTSRSFENVLVTSYEVWDFMKDTKPRRLEQCFRSLTRTKFTFVKNFKIPSKLLTIIHPRYRSITICVNSFW